jgi:UDP-glucose 4-epimerase
MKKPEVLVVGGAGYIGSHMLRILQSQKEYQVTIIDNLSTGFEELVTYGNLVIGDLLDCVFLDEVFSLHNFEAVIHFAAFSQVSESVKNPSKYYLNNVVGTINLLNAMLRHNVKSIVFSSTAAVYGHPTSIPITESHLTKPINPYGSSKLVAETVIKDYCCCYGFRSVIFRYFNAAGADPSGLTGESHNPETHLIPLLLKSALNHNDIVIIYGGDYDTKDGTCIRDYVHVVDICDAHCLALEYFKKMPSGSFTILNLGSEFGFSVNEIVTAVQRVVGLEGMQVRTKLGERRAGDPSVLIADSSLARKLLDWSPKYLGLDSVIGHAWAWEKSRSKHVSDQFLKKSDLDD